MHAIDSTPRLRRTRRWALVLSFIATLLVVAPVLSGSAAAAGAEGEHHEESLGAFLSRVVNSALLFGGIYYLVRKPLAEHLARRSAQVTTDLAAARETTATATVRLQEIEGRLRRLPAELDELRRRGAEEIAAEQERIREQAAHERERLLEQTRREVDRRLRTARRELTELAAHLSVDVARARLAAHMTADDQHRLIDRYAVQMRTTHD
jgi:F-type H+-transporting ATPase subunit b